MVKKRYSILLKAYTQNFEPVNKKGNFTCMLCGNKPLSCTRILVETMRKILSEKNVAAVLFVLVILAFSFAHEDSKKRSLNYNASAKYLTPDKRVPAITVHPPSTDIVVKRN